MPTPFPFVANSVLTAAQLNSISELPTRTLTGSAAAVAADSYSRVILNGTSITYTINTSTFSAGQVVELYNANSTAATIAAGAGVTLNGAAGLTLAQYQTAELYAISATSFVLWKSDVTQTAAGLELISATTIGSAVSTVTVSGAFSSTYDNYRIIINGGVASTTSSMQMQLGATTTGYYDAGVFVAYNSTTVNGNSNANAASWLVGQNTVDSLDSVIDLRSPNLAKNTHFSAQFSRSTTTGPNWAYGGYVANTTQYTAFTVFPNTGTITGGTIRVYGYRN